MQTLTNLLELAGFCAKAHNIRESMLQRTTFSVVFVFPLICLSAAGQGIGTATARGPFLVNNSSVSGNATLLEGAVIRSDKASVRLQFNSGAQLELAPGAQARVSAAKAVLDMGTGDYRPAPNFTLEAAGIRVEPSSTARVGVDNAKQVTVADRRSRQGVQCGWSPGSRSSRLSFAGISGGGRCSCTRQTAGMSLQSRRSFCSRRRCWSRFSGVARSHTGSPRWHEGAGRR